MRTEYLVYGVPDLSQGIALVEEKTGVCARFGGQHPGRGTHNALLALLGDRRYLEIIALHLAPSGAPGLLFPELRTLAQPRLVAWAVAVDSLADIAQRAESAKVENTDELTKGND
jgi:Glyoxalase-like domain